MQNRLLLQLAVLFILGIFSILISHVFIIAAFVFIVILLTDFYRKNMKKIKLAAMFFTYIIAIICSVVVCKNAYNTMNKSYETFVEGDRITLRGEVYKKEKKEDSTDYYLKNIIYKGKSGGLGNALVYSANPDILIGDIVIVEGSKLSFSNPQNEGEFDYKLYLASQKVFLILEGESIRSEKTRVLPIADILYEYGNEAYAFYEKYLPGEEAGILGAMVLGKRQQMDMETKELFRNAGLSHILAISGLHISVIGMFLYKLLRFRGASFTLSGILTSGIMWIYSVMTGFGYSVQRAYGMFVIMLLANALGRAYDIISAWSLMLIVLLFKNPLAIYNSGFVLSFAVTFFIASICIPLSSLFLDICKKRWESVHKSDGDRKWRANAKESFVSAFISGSCIQISSLPILAYYYHLVPILVVFLNMLVIPFLSVLLAFGIIAAIAKSTMALYICHYILYYYEFLADAFSKNSLFSITIATPDMWKVVIYYLVLFIAVRLILKMDFTKSFGRLFLLYKRLPQKRLYKSLMKRNPRGYMAYKKLGYNMTKAFVGFFVAVLILVKLLSFDINDGFEIDMLSVGQGEGIYIKSEDGVNFFVDGGSTSKKSIGKNTILPFLRAKGVSCIDKWMITHMDEDHYNGVIEVINAGLKVNAVLLPKVYVDDESKSVNEFKDLCNKNEISIEYVESGDRIVCENMEMKILYPKYPPIEKGTNENCMVVSLSYDDFQCLFTGDISSKQEEILLNSKEFQSFIKNNEIEVLKLAHHGSKNSNSIEWLKAVNPQMAIISAGKNNSYGHPSKETIERLDDLGVKHYSTIDCGRISIRYENQNVIFNEWNRCQLK